MNREDIIRMAQEAGFVDYELDDGTTESFDKRYERFAALVASAERERIKQANAPEIERINVHIKELEDAVIAEREACANTAGLALLGADKALSDRVLKAIRARGQA